MRIRSIIVSLLFVLGCMSVSNADPPSGLKPVHHTINATCLASFNADPKSYDNLDAKAYYSCFDSSIGGGCRSNMSVWWAEPPGATAGPRFRYSCMLTSNGVGRPVCQAGFSYALASDPNNANVKYTCTSEVVTCAVGFTVNSGDPDWFGYKSGGFLYRCTRSS